MKIAKMRDKTGAKVSSSTVAEVMIDLKRAFRKAAFETDVCNASSTSIKIGLHMRCFQIDITRLPYNARTDRYTTSVGWKRTNLPTWEQRVEFNDIVNSVLDRHGVSANVRSGHYMIREGMRKYNEYDWLHQARHYTEVDGIYSITPEMEEDAAERRRQKARERRHREKNVEARKQVNGTTDANAARTAPRLTLVKG